MGAPTLGASFLDLRRYGNRTAVVTSRNRFTYLEIAEQVERVAGRLGAARRLVLLAGANNVETLVAYLAALSGGHVLIMSSDSGDDRLDRLTSTYNPDIVMRTGDGRHRLDVRRSESAHALHPDLALLLATSGTTGSPKLVRLSYGNLQSNAAAITAYLGLTGSDRAPTVLPMHYSYGLSVVNSHLLVGGTLVVTDRSVVDPNFWDLFRSAKATSLAGVPYTFELLEGIGFPDMALPNLRYITQAGGRLAPELVRRYARLGQRRGWDFFVMYGQTEATARMAYLPPGLAEVHPQTIGLPIPGGSFKIRPVEGRPDPELGELVYSGPNVMLGYAETPADLSLGQTVSELRTGDLARRTDAGLYEVVGRMDRHVKLFGLRVDLDHVERVLGEQGVSAACAVNDQGRLVIIVEQGRDPSATREIASEICGLPSHHIQVVRAQQLPRRQNGKFDYVAVAAAGSSSAIESSSAEAGVASRVVSVLELRDLYREVLDRDDVTDDSTFVSLGGDSLSYVEMSVRLEQMLGHLPEQWHTTPLRKLSPARRARRGRAVDTSVLLRAVSILLIVGAHTHLPSVQGGAHLLLAVAGFNFARFHLTAPAPLARLRHGVTSIARVAVPSMVWIAGVAIVTGTYGLANLVFLNGLLDAPWSPRWQLWFLDVLVWTLVAVVALLSVPTMARWERRAPYGFALSVLGAGLAIRYLTSGIEADIPERYTIEAAAWFFTLGWAAAKTENVLQRLVLTGITLVAVPGFFGQPQREAVIVLGVVLLVWTTQLRVPQRLATIAGVLASSSLYVYLTHYQVYPHFEVRLLGVLASFAVGITYWRLATPMLGRLAKLTRHVAFSRRLVPRPRRGAPA